MTLFVTLMFVSWIYATFLGYLARKGFFLIDKPLFHYTSLALLFILMGSTIGSLTLGEAGSSLEGYGIAISLGILIAGYAIILGILMLPYISYLIGHYFYTLTFSINGIKTDKTYDKAVKAELEKDYDKAIQLYLEYAEEDPDDLEVKRRIAEVYYTKGDFSRAYNTLKDILPFVKNEEAKAFLSARMYDILTKDLKRPEDAKILLEQVAKDISNRKLRGFIESRLKRL